MIGHLFQKKTNDDYSLQKPGDVDPAGKNCTVKKNRLEYAHLVNSKCTIKLMIVKSNLLYDWDSISLLHHMS